MMVFLFDKFSNQNLNPELNKSQFQISFMKGFLSIYSDPNQFEQRQIDDFRFESHPIQSNPKSVRLVWATPLDIINFKNFGDLISASPHAHVRWYGRQGDVTQTDTSQDVSVD